MFKYLFLFLVSITNVVNVFSSQDPTILVGKNKISIECGNIVKKKADFIVNAANFSLSQGGGVCGVIFNAAGAKDLRQECEKALKKTGKTFLKEGDVVFTPSLKLTNFEEIAHIIPTNFNEKNIMQPAISFDKNGENLLGSCYTNALEKISEKKGGSASVVFPFLSGGNFCRDKKDLPILAQIALDSVVDFCKKNDSELKINFVLFSKDDYNLFAECIASHKEKQK